MLQITDVLIRISDTVSLEIILLDLRGYIFWNRFDTEKRILTSDGWTHDVYENKMVKKGTFARCHDVHENKQIVPSLTHDAHE